jgi:hypothetical protein
MPSVRLFRRVAPGISSGLSLVSMRRLLTGVKPPYGFSVRVRMLTVLVAVV